MSKKLLSLALAVVMVALAIPAAVLPAFAADVVESGGPSSYFTAADDIVAYKDGYTTTGQIFEYAQENWEIGGLSVTDPKSGYYTANYYNATYKAVAGDKANFAQTANGAGFYLSGWQGPGMLCFAAGYSGSGDNRTCTGLLNNVTARYTAPYTGTVTIDVTKLIFANTWSALFCVLVNGEPVGQFDTEGFDYASGAGWLDPTATDSTALVEDITVTVNKGDVIDFVVRGTGADINNIGTLQPGEAFVYSGAKYGLTDWGFGVTYVTSVKTSFNIEENFILNGVDTWATTIPTAADITNNGAWQAGLYGVKLDETKIVEEGATLWDYLTIDNSFMAFNKIGSATTGQIHVERQDHAGSFQSRALFLQKSSEHRAGWGIFLNTGADYGYTTDGTQPSRPLKEYPNATAVRYTAQYSGKVSVTLDGGWYDPWAGDYQHLFVRHNGVEIIKDIVNTGTDVLETISLTVNKGDTIEFVSVIDPILSKEYSTNNPAAAAKWQSLTDVLTVRRGFRIDNIDVTYDSATAVVDSHFAGKDGGTVNNGKLGRKHEEVRFFKWFDANGELESGATLTEGCYAEVNPALIAAGIIKKSDSLTLAYEKFCKNIKAKDCIEVTNSDWKIGHYTDAGVLNEVKYPAYYHGKNLLLASSTVGDGGDGQFYVSGVLFDSLMNTVLTNLLSKEIMTGMLDEERVTVTAANAAQVEVGSLNIPFSSTVSSITTKSVADGAAALAHPDYYYLFPGYQSNSHAGFQYTAPKAGKLTFTFNSMYASKEFKYKVAVNGKYLQDWTNTDVNATGVESYIESLSFDVKKGDKITFVFSRGAGGSGVYVAPNITANLADAVNIAGGASLTMDEDYALNAYGSLADATAISAVVDGNKVAGVKQGDGSFKMVVKEGIKLTDLPTAEVEYHMVAEVNGHTITGAPTGLNGEKMLLAYAEHSDEKVATLAKDLHYLALAANYLNSKTEEGYQGTALTDEQVSWITRNQTALEALSGDVTYTGEDGKYVIAGTNVNLGDRMSLLLLIAADESASIWDLQNGNYKLHVYNDTYTYDASEFKWVDLDGKDYMGIIVDDIPVVAYGETFKFEVQENGVAVSSTLEYGLNTWCVRMATKATDEAQKNVAYAVYNLGASAAAYKASL